MRKHHDDNKKKYDKVVEKFDLYFAVRRNVICERARFNRRVQHEGESAETYISDLYELSEFCNYGDLKDEMLRDTLVVGIRDTGLSEKMQTDPTLNHDKTTDSFPRHGPRHGELTRQSGCPTYNFKERLNLIQGQK